MRARSTAIALMAVAAATASAQMANTGGGRPSVSPDGRWITFSALRDGEWEIYVIHPDGTGARRITNARERNFVNLGPPTWIGNRVLIWQRISDTTRLSLVDMSGDPPMAGRANSTGLQVPFDAVQIRPSPDGRRLVFVHGDRRLPRIAIANVDGSDLHDLIGGSTPVGNPDWSRDGTRIAFTVIDSASRGQIAVIDTDGTNYRVLTHLDPAEGLPQWANWTPDGKRLVIQAGKYNRTKIEASTAHLWVVEVATGDATKLAPHTGFSLDETPSWFPDGKRIAFQSNRNGVMQVWTMKADGTDARLVTPLQP